MTARKAVLFVFSGGYQRPLIESARTAYERRFYETVPKAGLPLPGGQYPLGMQVKAFDRMDFDGHREVVLVGNHGYEGRLRDLANQHHRRDRPVRFVVTPSTGEHDQRGALRDLYAGFDAVRDFDHGVATANDRIPFAGYGRLVQRVAEHGATAMATVAVPGPAEAGGHGVVETETNRGRILAFREKPGDPRPLEIVDHDFLGEAGEGITQIPTGTYRTGIAVYGVTMETFDLLRRYLDAGFPADPPGTFIERLVQEGRRVFSVPCRPDDFRNVGNREAYRALRRELRRERAQVQEEAETLA